jgi:hypothetical protein
LHGGSVAFALPQRNEVSVTLQLPAAHQ